MKVFVTGATGFIGRALVLALRRKGHTVVGWVRCEKRARALLGDEVERARGPALVDRLDAQGPTRRHEDRGKLAGRPVLGIGELGT